MHALEMSVPAANKSGTYANSWLLLTAFVTTNSHPRYGSNNKLIKL